MTQNNINNTASDITVDNLFLDGNTISSTDTNGNIVLAPDGLGVVSVTTSPIVPSGDRAEDLGSASNNWGSLYFNGISFNDGTDILDSYVAKTSWTPTVEFGGGSTGITYTTQSAVYVRIGEIVFININVLLSNKGSSTGTAQITGLPFTAANDSANSLLHMNCSTVSTTSATYYQFYGEIVLNSTGINLGNYGDNVNATLTDTNFSNNSGIYLSGFYFI